ncbi:MAG: DUF6567 family protein [Bacteroidota bacterium]
MRRRCLNKFKTIIKNYLKILLLCSAVTGLSSCSVSLPLKQNQSNEISINNTSQIEALNREEYNVLRTTTGSASTSRFYILFFPLGKYKTNVELYENAYYKAVDNLPNADALILPRQEIKRFIIPLILFNYSNREVTVSGVGISVKDKVMENIDSDVPFSIARDYCLKTTLKSKQLSNPKITTQKEFERIFQKSTTMDENSSPTSIDFSKQYVIAIVDRATKNKTVINADNLKVRGDDMTLFYKIEEGEKQTCKIQPSIILVIDKKYQGEIRLKKV